MEGKQEILMIREEKHNEYLHKADGKSLSLKNKKNNKNSNQYNDLQDRNANKNDPKKPQQSILLDMRFLCNYRWFSGGRY